MARCWAGRFACVMSLHPPTLQARFGASPPTRGIPGATSSPGIKNFVMFPALVEGGGECYKGPSRKCGPGLSRTRRASLGAQATGEGARTSGLGECPCPPHHSPPLLARPPVGGRFPPLPETLCRRSPAPGMGAVTAFGPRARFLARVGERGAPALPILGTCGRRVVAASVPATRHISRWEPLPPSLPFLPAGQRAGAGGASPRVTFPRTAHALSPTPRGRGCAGSRECRA
ncbi:uncharacterized protein LOC117035435 [Rhinolophus ferrumequinum]|uniref:uncharacterized protein LOC117035435 n=1 Tax=Rhinolophus ferrumequinum TaxID=59479 RepID=UPI00140FF703|nr:uncharacterized protein LOC117035435 [Rhinolophus ferrumequinum]